MSEAEPHPLSYEDEEAFLAGVEEARKSLDAGYYVSWEDTRRWLLSWGTENELPPPPVRCK